ncbi:hypothetical protein FRB94_013755 [Tulasnella sp. JGI-2019a]|nr:hypothetical protein FRB94_013755 [Tulasnella sp. JGI-2019a]
MIAGYAWVIYDWLITLDQEIFFVWARPSGWKSKALFGFIRYYGIALLTFDMIALSGTWGPSFCHNYFYVLGSGGFLLLFAVEAALQLRVYALYNCNRRLLIFNAIWFIAEATTMVTLFLIDTAQYKPTKTPAGLTGCWSTAIGQNYTQGIWWICLAFEGWLSFLVTRKAYQSFRDFGLKSTIFLVLIRDSLVWFFLLGGCLLWMGLGWLLAPPGLILLGVPLTHASATIGGSRLLLNLRSASCSHELDTLVSFDVASSGSPISPGWRPRGGGTC